MSPASHAFVCLLGLLCLPQARVSAAPDTAVVRKVIGRASAKVDSSLPPGTPFTTGARSKSELATSRGVVRVGQKAQLETTRSGLALRQGMTLVASEPGRFRKTIEVRAPGYRLKVKGTAQVAFEPGRSLKVAVLEGTVTVSLDSLMGEFETLQPGQMLIINPSDNRIPDPVEFDLQRLVATSALLGGEFGPLATSGQIGASTGRQETALVRGDAALTDLLLRGTDNAIELLRTSAAREQAESARRAEDAGQVIGVTRFVTVDDKNDPGAILPERPHVFPDGAESASEIGTMRIARDGTLNVARAGTLVVNVTPDRSGPTALPPRITGEVTADPDAFGGRSRTLLFRTLTSAIFDPGVERLKIGTPAGGPNRTSVITPDGVGLTFSASAGMDVSNALLSAGDTAVPDEPLLLEAANGGITISDGAELRGGTIDLQGGPSIGQKIVVERSSKLTAKRDATIGNPVLRTDIVIRDSSELASIAANVSLFTRRGAINVESGAKLSARNRLLIDAYIGKLTKSDGALDETPGLVSLRNVQLDAPRIRVRGFAPSGDGLVIDGATFNRADKLGQLIELFAEGGSTLRFRNNVVLNANKAVLAGHTVEVEPGGSVKIAGKGEVQSNQHNYNQGNFGTIDAKKGLTKKPFTRR